MIHEISIGAAAFSDITAGRLFHIMQKDTDAQYQVGDFLALNETVEEEPAAHPGSVGWTGRCCLVQVTNITHLCERYALPGTLALSFQPCRIASNRDFMRPGGRDPFECEVYGGFEEESA